MTDLGSNYAILYSQPVEEGPYVVISKLKRGIYEECNKLSRHSFIRFTDLGLAALYAAREMESTALVRLENASHLEEDKSWEVAIKLSGFRVQLKCRRYKDFGSFPGSFFISIQLMGKKEKISQYLQKLTGLLRPNPYEMRDWGAFIKKTGTVRAYIVNTWVEGLGFKEPVSSYRLYAQPAGEGSPLMHAQLKKGVMEPWAKMSMYSPIYLTDLGELIINTAKEISENVEVKLEHSSSFEEDKAWQISIGTPTFSISIESSRYRAVGKFPNAFFIMLDLSGELRDILGFLMAFHDSRENLFEMSDWNSFTKKAGLKRETIAEAWDNLEENLKSLVSNATVMNSQSSLTQKVVQRSIDSAGKWIKKAEKRRIQVNIAGEFLAKARNNLQAREMAKAFDSSLKAKEIAKMIISYRNLSFKEIQECQAAIQRAKDMNLNVADSESVMDAARMAVKKGDYENALFFAMEGLEMAQNTLGEHPGE